MPDQPLDFLTAVPTPSGSDSTLDSPGPPPPDTPFTVDFPPDDGGGPYTHFGLCVSVFWSGGVSSAPTAGGPRSPRVFWRVCGASSVKVVEFAVARYNGNPQVPHVSTGTSNDVLIDWFVSLPTKHLMPDGSEAIVIAGRYTYEQIYAIDPLDTLVIPNHALGLAEYTQLYPPTFTRSLIGPAVPPGDYDGSQVNF